MSFINICLTWLICLRADIQDNDVLIMWSLNEILLPRFLTKSTGKGQRKFLGGGGGDPNSKQFLRY